MNQEMIQFVQEYLERTDPMATCLKKRFPFRKRYEHSLRVLAWAKRINAVEQGDPDVVEIAALFHDVGKGLEGKRGHEEVGAEICTDFLRQRNFSEEKIQAIGQAIRFHSNKDDRQHSFTIEERVVMDADLLDETGALTILWDSLDAGSGDQPCYYQTYKRIAASYEEKKEEIHLFKTKEGKRLFLQRLAALEQFLYDLKFELGI